MARVLNRTQIRRSALDAELPLVDYQGVVVLRDRRKLADRRKARCGLEDLKVILAKLAATQIASE